MLKDEGVPSEDFLASTLDREAALKTAREYVESAKIKDGRAPIAVIPAGQGGGKTELLEHILHALCGWNGHFVPLFVSFNSHTPFDPLLEREGNVGGLVARLVFSYFSASIGSTK